MFKQIQRRDYQSRPCRYLRRPVASALFALWPRTVVHASRHVEAPLGGHFQVFLLRLGRTSISCCKFLLIFQVFFWQEIELIGVLKILEEYFCFVLSD